VHFAAAYEQNMVFCAHRMMHVGGRLRRYLREQLNAFRGVIADPTLPQGMMHGDIFPDNGTVRHQQCTTWFTLINL
jgi:hypothetical protein